jgi:hypothetical protein
LLHRPAVHTQTTIVRSTALLSATSIDGVNPELPSDFNGDGTVSFDDFFVFADAFGQSVAGKLVVASTPTSFALEPNYPNPFNAETLLSYRLATSGPVQLAIYIFRETELSLRA